MLVHLSQEPNALRDREEQKELPFEAHQVGSVSMGMDLQPRSSTVLGIVGQAPRSLASFVRSCPGQEGMDVLGADLPVCHAPSHRPEGTMAMLVTPTRNEQSEAGTPCLLFILRPWCDLEESAAGPLASVFPAGRRAGQRVL